MNSNKSAENRRVAFYGGTFDPPHNGHLTIARKLIDLFALDEFVFIPAFHGPHKKNRKPTPAFHRFAMLSLATNDEPKISVSTVELDAPEMPFTFATQMRLKDESNGAEIFFVIGADSWQEITTWREWETVLTQTNIIVVTRPDYEIGFSHVTKEIEKRIVDLRNNNRKENNKRQTADNNQKIYITDAVNLDISATEIRRKICASEDDWRKLVPDEVAKYVEKYELYI